MKTDLYTKAVLTVIAISLSALAIQFTIKDAHAQSGQFRFTQSGALIIAVCDPSASSATSSGRYLCADIVNGGQLRTSNN